MSDTFIDISKFYDHKIQTKDSLRVRVNKNKALTVLIISTVILGSIIYIGISSNISHKIIKVAMIILILIVVLWNTLPLYFWGKTYLSIDVYGSFIKNKFFMERN